jgi:hypothetical protein
MSFTKALGLPIDAPTCLVQPLGCIHNWKAPEGREEIRRQVLYRNIPSILGMCTAPHAAFGTQHHLVLERRTYAEICFHV